jgi:hypothetical protein
VGLYPSSGPAGPFAHIDVRGERARWVLGGHVRQSRRHNSRTAKSSRPKAKRVASAQVTSRR